jgi:hypothetical protein
MHFSYNKYHTFCHAEVLLRSIRHQKCHNPVLACPTCAWNLSQLFEKRVPVSKYAKSGVGTNETTLERHTLHFDDDVDF